MDGEDPFSRKCKCKFCPLLVLPANLKNHQRVCFRNPDKETQKPEECEVCGLKVSSKSNLIRHKKKIHNLPEQLTVPSTPVIVSEPSILLTPSIMTPTIASIPPPPASPSSCNVTPPSLHSKPSFTSLATRKLFEESASTSTSPIIR
jgi:hypothetical protein